MNGNTNLLLTREDVYEAISLLLEKRKLTRTGGYSTDLRVQAKLIEEKGEFSCEIKDWEFILIPNL